MEQKGIRSMDDTGSCCFHKYELWSAHTLLSITAACVMDTSSSDTSGTDDTFLARNTNPAILTLFVTSSPCYWLKCFQGGLTEDHSALTIYALDMDTDISQHHKYDKFISSSRPCIASLTNHKFLFDLLSDINICYINMSLSEYWPNKRLHTLINTFIDQCHFRLWDFCS